MKKYILFILFLISVATEVFAQNTPEQTVNEIISKMKQSQSPVVVLDYVNWDKAFKRFPASQKEQLKVRTSAELRQFFDNMLRNPSEVVKQRINAEINKAAPEQQESLRANLEQVVVAIKKKEEEMKRRVMATNYQVGQSDIRGNVATVLLTQTYNGEKRTEKVILEKEGDRWLLPSAELGAQQGNNQAGGNVNSGDSSAGSSETQF